MIGEIKRKTIGSCGYDFHAPKDIELMPGTWTEINTEVCFDGSEKMSGYDGDWFMLVVPRSGLGTKYGFRLKNTVGVIDMDYRDPIRATVTTDIPLIIEKGDRYMQGIFLPYLHLVQEEGPSDIRSGGYGSTGLR